MDFPHLIAQKMGHVNQNSVANTINLLDEGGTVPFIARYRKEKTGSLDEKAILDILEFYTYFKDLWNRKETILKTIEKQDRLTPQLREQIESILDKTELEDLYLPYKPKRKTRASQAREKGLTPLAEFIMAQAIKETEQSIEQEAANYLDPEKGVKSLDDALAGARDIIAESVAERADFRKYVRELTLRKGRLKSTVKKGKEDLRSKFEDYYDFSEQVSTIPSHRVLAAFRGEKEEFLTLSVQTPEDEIIIHLEAGVILAGERNSGFRTILQDSIADAYKRLMAPSIANDIRAELKKRAEASAMDVFAENTRNLLLQPPMGGRRVLAIDPGLRTGSKVVLLDETGKFLRQTVLFFTHSGRKAKEAEKMLKELIYEYQVEVIAVGNGTGSREATSFVKRVLGVNHISDIPCVVVNESGASVYSASEVAREEFPRLDITARGSISIGRRLMDPLAELVKIDPKSIGVGQYQYDVNQGLLKKRLDQVVESCVNYVGVDLNTSSVQLLKYVAGINKAQAANIINYRQQRGVFTNKTMLLQVPKFGEKSFEQAAGFLRIRNGDSPLDNTAVHPETYPLVEKMAFDGNISVPELIGNQNYLDSVDVEKYVTSQVGLPTVRDIITELKQPGRDPRQKFEPPPFEEGVTQMSHLKEGMALNGIVTNVTDFGAFVDLGVHQDGLVHKSNMADYFVSRPAEVVKVGEVVAVKVLEVDLERKRISLTMRDVDAQKAVVPEDKIGKGSKFNKKGDKKGDKKGKKAARGGYANRPFADLLGKLKS